MCCAEGKSRCGRIRIMRRPSGSSRRIARSGGSRDTRQRRSCHRDRQLQQLQERRRKMNGDRAEEMCLQHDRSYGADNAKSYSCLLTRRLLSDRMMTISVMRSRGTSGWPRHPTHRDARERNKVREEPRGEGIRMSRFQRAMNTVYQRQH